MFSPDGKYLITDRGQITLPFVIAATVLDQEEVFPSAFVHGIWVGLSEQRLLWLPPEYRPGPTAVYKDMVCIGHVSGHVTFLKFDPDVYTNTEFT